MTKPPILRLRGVHKTLRGQHILRGVDLDIEDGENMVIIGRSGGGKSVLLRHIMGLLKPDKGEVWFRDRNLVDMDEESITPLRREMGMLFQNGALFDSMTVGENVAFSLVEQGKMKPADIKTEVARALKIVDLPNQEQKMPAELSGGMRKRIALARAAITRPALMMYDEPTAGLDPIMADSITKLIARLGKELDMTNIVVTHDMISAYEMADRIAMLHEGKIYTIAPPAEIEHSDDPVIKRFVKGMSQASDAVF
ncbi:MAG: ABC transporter ATP-binding protein [Candidatus Methylacidiphilales bacterium]|nr:ATP-binding cassette domain-containing protein [Candidatus Methylacidiphilales bacterium]